MGKLQAYAVSLPDYRMVVDPCRADCHLAVQCHSPGPAGWSALSERGKGIHGTAVIPVASHCSAYQKVFAHETGL